MNETLPQDSIHYAAQLGRLDFISALLACIGIILVCGGAFAYLNLRGLAKKVAREEAHQQAKTIAEKEANIYLQKELPELVNEYLSSFGMSSLSESKGDDIADVQNKEED